MFTSRKSAPLHGLCIALFLALQHGLHAQQTPAGLDAARVILGPSAPPIHSLVDLDGDARLDALGMTGSNTTTELRLYQNQGDGTFATALDHTITWSTSFATAENPLEVADFDGDGRRDDFAIAHWNELRLFRWTPQGLVAAPAHAYQHTVYDLLAVDLDQDGSDDLVALTGDLFSLTLSVTLNPFSSTPTSLSLALSIPGGGNLMAIRRVGGTVSLVAGSSHVVYTPGGGLTHGPGWGIPAITGHAVSGDLDGDGDEDGVIFDPTNRRYQRFLQDGNGNLAAEAVREGTRASDLVDLDGDGDLDAVHAEGIHVSGASAAPWQDNVSLLEFGENDGTGVFGPAKVMRGFGAFRLAGVSDLDGDGDLDFLAGRSIYFGNTASVFDRPYVDVEAQAIEGTSRTGLDLDLDGDPDLGLSAHAILENDGSGNFSLETPSFFGVVFNGPPGYLAFVLGDWNQDGTPDLGHNHGPVHIAYNHGGGAMSWSPTPVATQDAALAFQNDSIVADLDDDGDLDCVGTAEGTFSPGTIHIAFRTGPESFSSGGVIQNAAVVAAVDVNGDGLRDLIAYAGTTLSGPSELRWYAQSAQHGFAAGTPIAAGFPNGGRPLVRDVDGDGDVDLVAWITGVGHVLFTNDGLGNFAQSLLAPAGTITPTSSNRYALLDVTGDGIDDLLASPAPEASFCSLLLEGTPAGFVATDQVYALVPSVASDVDGDGDPDLVDLPSMSVHRNRVIDGPNRGTRRQYGVGTAGTDGLVPTLGASGPFREGEQVTLHLRNAKGNTTAFIALSTIPAMLSDYPVTGLTSVVDPLAPTSLIWGPITLDGIGGLRGTGSTDLAFTIPIGAAGLEIHHQAFLLDPQGPSGIAASEGLVIRYGL